MHELDLLIAKAQVRLATMFGLMLFGVILTLLLSLTKVTELAEGVNLLLTTMTGVLGTIVTQQQGYFFARHRPPAIDPESAPPTNVPTVQPTT